MSNEPMAYLGRCVCGGWIMKCVDDPRSRKRTAKDIAELISEGFTIERMTIEEVNAENTMCEHRGKCTTEPESLNEIQTNLFPA